MPTTLLGNWRVRCRGGWLVVVGLVCADNKMDSEDRFSARLLSSAGGFLFWKQKKDSEGFDQPPRSHIYWLFMKFEVDAWICRRYPSRSHSSNEENKAVLIFRRGRSIVSGGKEQRMVNSLLTIDIEFIILVKKRVFGNLSFAAI